VGDEEIGGGVASGNSEEVRVGAGDG
ncbi:hypothetical protein MNBD_PLANCTO03-1008, partial [hydrothermal vent metagenome]